MNTDSKNPPKIFISHSTDNAKIASVLVDLLDFLGLGNKEIFCSSVPSCDIPVGEDIYQWIKSEYEDHDLFMIYLISSAYLDSPISLNEMGAAWVLKNDYQTFILPNLNVNSLDRTCIGKNSIVIRWDDNNIKARMNQFKDKIIALFGLSAPNESRWEDKRDEFIKKFQSYQSVPKEQEDKMQTTSKEKSENQPNVQKEHVNNIVLLDSPFKDEYHLKSYINKIYEQLFQFEKSQLQIEAIRLNTSNKERITPISSIVKNVWADGYRVIRSTNELLTQKSVSEEYLAEARAIESFVYYNMAMLWGNIPIVKSTQLSEIMRISQSEAETVYRYCLELLKKCPAIQSLDNGHVTDSFVNILYTELYLSLGQKDLAYSHLKNVSSFNNSIFTLNVVDKNKTKSTIDIYTQKYVELLKEEIEGKDNSIVWFNRGAIYGTWAALKRLGKAQSLTGIKDYELLLPIPQSEVYLDPHIRQNPGY